MMLRIIQDLEVHSYLSDRSKRGVASMQGRVFVLVEAPPVSGLPSFIPNLDRLHSVEKVEI